MITIGDTLAAEFAEAIERLRKAGDIQPQHRHSLDVFWHNIRSIALQFHLYPAWMASKETARQLREAAKMLTAGLELIVGRDMTQYEKGESAPRELMHLLCEAYPSDQETDGLDHSVPADLQAIHRTISRLMFKAEKLDKFSSRTANDEEASTVTKYVIHFWRDDLGRPLSLGKRNRLSKFTLVVFDELGQKLTEAALVKRLQRAIAALEKFEDN